MPFQMKRFLRTNERLGDRIMLLGLGGKERAKSND